jgi:uncharacterized membrane protein
MKFLTGTFARILYALPFVVFGINHFINATDMQHIVPSFFPLRIYWVYLTGAALIAAGLSIITKIQAKLAALLLALMLAVFIVTIHIPGLFNEQTWQMSMISLLKDLSLAAAALLIAGMVKEK